MEVTIRFAVCVVDELVHGRGFTGRPPADIELRLAGTDRGFARVEEVRLSSRPAARESGGRRWLMAGALHQVDLSQ
jgi:hypothetical protein